MSKKIVDLFIVDPQNDFCVNDDGAGHKGTLVVPGAMEDMQRLTKMVERLGARLDRIHVTVDSHQLIVSARPRWGKRADNGQHPDPFTCLGIHPDGRRIVAYTPGGSNPNAFGMSPTEVEYVTYNPSFLHQGGPTGKGSFGYLEKLAERGRYPHIVWTVHCVVGTWGWSIVPELSDALCAWESDNFRRVNYVTKGNNPWTEHFSGVMAEVEDPSDPSTRLNMRLIQALEQADVIGFTGEALSHCVANTGRDIVGNFTDPRYASKIVLLTDTSSNVPGFDFLGDAFLRDMAAKGMQMATSETFLA